MEERGRLRADERSERRFGDDERSTEGGEEKAAGSEMKMIWRVGSRSGMPSSPRLGFRRGSLTILCPGISVRQLVNADLEVVSDRGASAIAIEGEGARGDDEEGLGKEEKGRRRTDGAERVF